MLLGSPWRHIFSYWFYIRRSLYLFIDIYFLYYIMLFYIFILFGDGDGGDDADDDEDSGRWLREGAEERLWRGGEMFGEGIGLY